MCGSVTSESRATDSGKVVLRNTASIVAARQEKYAKKQLKNRTESECGKKLSTGNTAKEARQKDKQALAGNRQKIKTQRNQQGTTCR